MTPVDVKFDLIWRRGTTDMSVVTWTEHYEPIGNGNYQAQPFEYDEPGTAVDFVAGDKLVFRYSAVTATGPEAYIPNGDGLSAQGRIPNFRLPK